MPVLMTDVLFFIGTLVGVGGRLMVVGLRLGTLLGTLPGHLLLMRHGALL
jgi:hypothetical protein